MTTRGWSAANVAGSAGIGAAVMCGEERIHLPDGVPRADEVEQRLAGQIAHVQESEVSMAHEHAGGARILVGILRRNHVCRTRRVRGPRAGQRRGDRVTSRAHHRDFDVRQRQPIAGERVDVPRALATKLGVNGKRVLRLLARRGCVCMRRTVIDEPPDRHQPCKLAHAPDVIGMEVRDEQVVDPRNARVASGRDDPVRIARLAWIAGGETFPVACPPCVDEQRV